MAHPFVDYIDRSVSDITDACTRCGACAEICPVLPHTGVDAPPSQLVVGVIDVLKDGGSLTGHAADWANQCDGCGACIPVCPEDINPRTMMMLGIGIGNETATETPLLFRKMGRAIRLLAAMQLAPADYQRLMRIPTRRSADVVFYVGCNAIRTPHLLFNTMYVLDALGIDYEVVGGPAACCGIIHTKWEGEREAGGRVAETTLRRFGEYEPDHVLSWCPSCELHLGETIETYQQTDFSFEHVTHFIRARKDLLGERAVERVPLRVVLHTHTGMAELGENVAELLELVPGLTIIDTVAESGYTCGGSGSDRSPGRKAETRDMTIERMRQGDADALVTLYHGCHGQLAAAGTEHGFGVVNFTDLLVRSLGGTPRMDFLEGWRLARDWQAIVGATAENLARNNTAVDTDWLLDVLPDVFAGKEFAGGLNALL